MASFKDEAGGEWYVKLTVGGIARCRQKCSIDLAKLVEDDLAGLTRIMSDPVLLCEVLVELMDKQLREKGVSHEDFGELMAGDAILGAQEAFYDAFVDFCPSQTRELLRNLAEKTKAAKSASIEKAKQNLDSVTAAALSEAMERSLAKKQSNP